MLFFFSNISAQHMLYKSIIQIDAEKHYKEREQVRLAKPGSAIMIDPLQERASLDPGMDHVVFGFLPWWMLDVVKPTIDLDLLTHIAIFDFACDYYGNYITDSRGDTIGYPVGWPEDWEELLNRAHAKGVKLLMSVSAYEFNKDIMYNILHDTTAGNSLIQNTVSVLKRYNLDGVILNFEHPYDDDKGDIMNWYTQKANDYFKEHVGQAQELVFAAPPINWGSLWNLPGLLNACDFAVVMGYDFWWSGSETTGPCAPIFGSNYNLLNTLDNVTTGFGNADQSKIVLVYPYYGFTWEVSENEKHIPGATTLGMGEHIVYSQIKPLYQTHGVYWDVATEEPWTYYQKNGRWYQSWCDNVISLTNKQRIIKDYGLKGTGMWALGYDGTYRELWDLLKDKYYVFSNSLEMDSFESGNGRFYRYPTFSGSTQGISTESYTEISNNESFHGNQSLKIVLMDDHASNLDWEVRLLSATGNPAKNAPIPKGYYLKFSVKTNDNDIEIALMIDDQNGELEISPRIPITGDNRWHEYSIKLDESVEWDSYENGNAWIDSSTLFLDALLICSPNNTQNKTIYLDAIKAEETGEPSTPSQSIHTLSNNYPNPFNLKTNITYNIKTNSHVEIYVYDIEGKKRACLIDKQLAPDEYSLEWNASSFASGIYFIQLRVDEQISDVEKVSLIK
jgi:spore germination protein YaaH